MTGLFVPAGSGASPILKPFVQPVKNPREGPAYIVVPVTIKAGATQGSAEFNPSASGMSQIASVVINATGVPDALTIALNSNFSWRVSAGGCLTAPAYWSGGIVYVSASLDVALLADVTVQIAFFNIEQTPQAAVSDMTVNGTVNASITNALLPVSGNVNANITNASIAVSGTVDITTGTVNVGNVISNSPFTYPVYGAQLSLSVGNAPLGSYGQAGLQICGPNSNRFSYIVANRYDSMVNLLLSLNTESVWDKSFCAIPPGNFIETCNPTYQGSMWVGSQSTTTQAKYIIQEFAHP
jgi:hypothetical protein